MIILWCNVKITIPVLNLTCSEAIGGKNQEYHPFVAIENQLAIIKFTHHVKAVVKIDMIEYHSHLYGQST